MAKHWRLFPASFSCLQETRSYFRLVGVRCPLPHTITMHREQHFLPFPISLLAVRPPLAFSTFSPEPFPLPPPMKPCVLWLFLPYWAVSSPEVPVGLLPLILAPRGPPITLLHQVKPQSSQEDGNYSLWLFPNCVRRGLPHHLHRPGTAFCRVQKISS